MLIREYLKKIVSTFHNRRLQRHALIQKNLDSIFQRENKGVEAKLIDITTYDPAKANISNKLSLKLAKIKVEAHKYLMIEKEPQITDNLEEFYE